MTTILTKGANALVSNSGQDVIVIKLSWNVPAAYELDASAFLLNEHGRVPYDDYMVFFNQPASPDQAVVYQADHQLFAVNLTKINSAIIKIAFTLTIYEGLLRKQQFNQLKQAAISVWSGSQEVINYSFSGQDLQQETALIVGELYLYSDVWHHPKPVWKFRAIGQGFNGGLTALCDHFGVSVEDDSRETDQPKAPAPAVVPLASTPVVTNLAHSKLVSLEKKLKDKPTLLSLAKTAQVSLAKVNLTQHQAKVAICLDISASMSSLYKSGKIQRLAEKVLALACQFDDDSSIDVFLFGEKAHHCEEMGIDNFSGFTDRLLQRHHLEGGTCYGKVMKVIRNFYFPVQISADKPLVTPSKLPVYVMFITDGNTSDPEETKRQLKGSSYEPIFWQFMAIGKSKKAVHSFLASLIASDFSFLESLDALPDRYLDNANFFSVEDPEHISDGELYDLMMAEYPQWFKQAVQQQMIVA